MIRKRFHEEDNRTFARVEFNVPDGGRAASMCLVGDFNDWHLSSHPMHLEAGIGWTLTVDLQVNRVYQFRYLRDGEEWMCDSQADGYVYNANGAHNFIVVTDPAFRRYSDDGLKDRGQSRLLAHRQTA
jgi:1,4-alpha-glucan branching enzyme